MNKQTKEHALAIKRNMYNYYMTSDTVIYD